MKDGTPPLLETSQDSRVVLHPFHSMPWPLLIAEAVPYCHPLEISLPRAARIQSEISFENVLSVSTTNNASLVVLVLVLVQNAER